MHLQDWTIKARYVNHLDDDTDLGNTEVFADLKEAHIKILHPKIIRHDVEATLVHELIHPHLDWTGLSGTLSHKTIRGEQSIESIAKALIYLDRRGKIKASRRRSTLRRNHG